MTEGYQGIYYKVYKEKKRIEIYSMQTFENIVRCNASERRLLEKGFIDKLGDKTYRDDKDFFFVTYQTEEDLIALILDLYKDFNGYELFYNGASLLRNEIVMMYFQDPCAGKDSFCIRADIVETNKDLFAAIKRIREENG